MTNQITSYFGTYTGLAPTDESKIAMGEIEIIISEHGLKSRHATGLRIVEETFPFQQFRKLSPDELRPQFKADSDAHTRVDGFQLEEGAIFLFYPNPGEHDARLIVRFGEFVDTLGVTMLYDKDQIANGFFDRIITAATEAIGSYPFPRLEYGGLHEPKVG